MRETLVKTEEFKDSPVGRIPHDWNYLTINDCLQNGLIVDVQDGNHGEAHPKNDDFVSEGIPFVMAKDLVNGQINIADCHKITWEKYQSLRVGFARPGDVLVSHKGTIGLTAIVPNWLQHLMLTPQVTYYRIPEGEKLSEKFLFWFFQSPLFQHRLEVLSAQSTRSYIGITLQKTLSILVPPFDEQKRIAEILDTIDSTIAQTTTLIAKLKQMQAGLLHDLLTRGLDENGELRDATQHPEQFKDSPLGRIPKDWEVKDLKSITSKVIDGTHFTPNYLEEGVPFLRVTDIQSIKIDFDNVKKISSQEHRTINTRCNPELGDILYSKNGTIGVTKVIDWEQKFSIFVSLCLIKPIATLVNCWYLVEMLQSPVVIEQIRIRSKQMTVVNLHLEEIREFLIPLPPIDEQKRIIKALRIYNNRLYAEEAYRDKLKLQKQGLMHDLLTGKMRVNQIKN
ncbi:restriction endonuclease subunit S [Floridanema evergladense]|uniref:Restriction endonuclease subunit S n=1 Tax=Floridaenema evergladense BLCC-F167 TaxID=3153639 RepID=A0ABV4WJ91_9CYAN